jgi:hypothetical protein
MNLLLYGVGTVASIALIASEDACRDSPGFDAAGVVARSKDPVAGPED